MDLSNRLLTLEINESDLYEIFLHEITKEEMKGENKKILVCVKSGIKIKFDFDDFVKGRFKKKTFVKEKNGREVGDDILKIVVGAKMFSEIEFYDEIFERVRLMRSWLWENMSVAKVGDLRGTPGSQDGE